MRALPNWAFAPYSPATSRATISSIFPISGCESRAAWSACGLRGDQGLLTYQGRPAAFARLQDSPGD